MTQAVILAGGRGTRLAEVSGDLPKPLVPVDGVPIIERQIALLVRYGIREIFLTTGYRAEVLAERLGDGSRFGARLHHVIEKTPLGTAGGVAALRGSLDERFLVVYGDVMVNMDLARLLDVHTRSGAQATLVVHPNDHPYDSDLVELAEDGRILAFHPKPRPEHGPDLRNQVSAALYVLEPSALDAIEPDVKQDFVVDVFPRMLASGAYVAGYPTTEYLKDMGTPDRLARVEADCRSGLVDALHRDHLRPTAFLDRDGVINEEIDGVHRAEDLRLIPGASDAIRRLNRAGWLCAVVTNQPALAKGFMTEADLEAVHRRLETELGRGHAWVDGVAHCPHHPDRGHPGERLELKVECACRKPGTGLVDRLMARLPVAAEASMLVGDSWRDMALAHARGLDAIGVMTGHGLRAAPPREAALAGRPDILVADLAAAVDLVLTPDPGVAALAEAIRTRRADAPDAPAVVLLGGLARSGKTTAAFRLRRSLRGAGLRARVVALDDWLIPAGDRTEGQTVAERYRLARLARDVDTLIGGGTVLAPGYDPRSRDALPDPVPYRGDADVLIFDGVPALLLEPATPTCIRVGVEAPGEAVRRARLRDFYAYKGLDGAQLDRLLAGRSEEHDRVRESMASAQIHLTPGATDTVQPGGVTP